MNRLFCLLLVASLNYAPHPLSAQSDRWTVVAANYDRIRSGMTIEQVRDLLGAPFDILTIPQPVVLEDGQSERIETWIYRRQEIVVTIGFRNGYVINKCWSTEPAVVANQGGE